MRVLPCGDRAILIELADQDRVRGLYAALRHRMPHGAEGVVAAARTILLSYDPGLTTVDRLTTDLSERDQSTVPPDVDRLIEIPVCYDGEDLDEVARLSGMTALQVIARHTGAEYTAAFSGFAPGFCYLTGVDAELRLPRRPVPRTKVPSGAVALADEFTAVYPRPSPGGWHIIGHTDMPMWNIAADPPATITPGARVRFVAS